MSDAPLTAIHHLDSRHELPIAYLDVSPADLYVPINGDGQLGDLVGKMLTLFDATGLPAEQSKAVKGLVRTQIRSWYADCQHNAETSYKGCIAPIVGLRDVQNGTVRKYVWLAEGNHAISVA